MKHWVAILAMLAACKHEDVNGTPVPTVPLTPAQQSQLDQQIARSTQRVREQDRGWSAAIQAVDPRDHTKGEPCDALLHYRHALAGNPQTDDWGSWNVGQPLGFNGSSIASLSRTPFPLEIVLPGAALPTESPELHARLATLAQTSAASWQSFDFRLQEASIDALTTTDVLIAFDRVEEPHQIDQRSFSPGLLVGRVWVFDHKSTQVVCAGIATASSSNEVNTASSNLADDLMIQLIRGLPDQVFAVAPAASARDAPLSVRTDSGAVPVPFGRVRVRDHALYVVLGDDDPGCGDQVAPDRTRVSFEIPAGPDGRFYAGKKIGVPVFVASSHTGSGLAAQEMQIAVTSVGRAPGAHLRGSVDLATFGAGTFDAVVCPEVDFATLRALPHTAPAHPFAGSLGGQPFAAQSATVTVDRDTHQLMQVRVFATPGITCATADADAGAQIWIGDIGGASVDRPLRGSPQPAQSTVRRGGAMTSYDPSAMWVQLDPGNPTLQAGQPLTGRLVIDAPPDHGAGTFRAVVCP